MKEVPIIRLNDLTDEQRRAYTLIHNKLTMNTGFDIEVLNIELAEIQEIDMEAFDFDIKTLDEENVYIDDFFERGVQAKDRAPVYGCKVICKTEEEAQELFNDLDEKGFEVSRL